MRFLALLALAGVVSLTACGGGSTLNPSPGPSSTPSANVDCPTSGAVPTSVSAGTGAQTLRRGVSGSASVTRFVPDELAVTYTTATSLQLRGTRIAEIDHAGLGVRTRIVSVDPASVDAMVAQLRTLPGVRSVGRVTYVQRMSITANDPYFVGFTGTTAPYFENAATPGQWDMHAIDMEGAWSQFSGTPIVGAPIAIVDTGMDLTHPELVTAAGISAPKVERAQCFVTYPSNSAQTTGQFVTDADGHGTNVAGIADGDTNNSFAFASVAFDAPLLAYRIFPSDPSGGCDVYKPPKQCFTTSADEASAINDAISHGAKVINLSLGSDPSPNSCLTSDPEYVAVENAISHGVVVVAAAGNGTGKPAVGQSHLDCPAADPGVIAVGATSLNDGNPLNVFEYVASYSNYLTTNGTANGGVFLVAPGGDPSATEQCGTCSVDHLHWIENIYSTTGTGISSGSTCAGGKDYAGEQNDCNVLIAGTSQATPHVTGVVSLMLAKNPNLTPAQIAVGLCASADDIADAKEGCGRLNASAAVSWAATH